MDDTEITSFLNTSTVTIADVLRRWPHLGPALMEKGLPCMGCAMAEFQTLAEAAIAHNVEEAKLLSLLREAV